MSRELFSNALKGGVMVRRFANGPHILGPPSAISDKKIRQIEIFSMVKRGLQQGYEVENT
jgi:hypothetical protein